MKRAGGLYPAVADAENLRLAFWRAARGKTHRADVIRYRERLGPELETLRRELAAGDVRVGDYRTFTVRDPKERTICAAAFRERVLHHALVNVCEPHFESYQIHDSYACRKGRGTHRALERARGFARTRPWHLKLDVRKYFDSIDHKVLLDLLARRFKERPLLDLFERLVTSYHTAPGKGVPIGNLTSQYFANHYLAPLDHFVKEMLGVRAYLRYMDDMILWGDDRETMGAWRRALEGFARERLLLDLRPPVVGRSAGGLSALGYRVFPHTVRLSGRSKRRFRRKLVARGRELADGRITEAEAALRTAPLVAFTRHASALGFRRKVLGAASRARTG